jgi:Flp pilus assembly protein TadG
MIQQLPVSPFDRHRELSIIAVDRRACALNRGRPNLNAPVVGEERKGQPTGRRNGMVRRPGTRGVGRVRLLAAVEGVSTIEFALIASMLSTLAVGMLDFGMALWQQMEVGNAARAGAEYAAMHGWGGDGSAIQTAATNATNLGSVTASPSQVCGCPNASSGVTLTGQSPPCTTLCANNAIPSTYVSVSAQASYALIVPFPGISSPINLTATAIARM